MIIQSVHRAMQVLSLFSLSTPRLGVSEIGRALGLHKGTVQGLIRTLVKEGFLQQDQETRKYQLGLKIYELGVVMAGSMEVNQKASTPAYQLAKQTKRLVRIAILDKDSAIITLDAYPRSEPYFSRQFGPRVPLYCTALGKALLAFFERHDLDNYLQRVELVAYTPNTITRRDKLRKELEETRKRGYSISREEHLLARAAIGAPIFGREGSLAAAMSLVIDPTQIKGEQLERLAKEVINTSMEISRYMGYFPGAAAARGEK